MIQVIPAPTHTRLSLLFSFVFHSQTFPDVGLSINPPYPHYPHPSCGSSSVRFTLKVLVLQACEGLTFTSFCPQDRKLLPALS